MLSLDYISPFSTLLPLLVFLPFLFKKKELPLKVIFFYNAYSFINDFTIIYRSDHGLKVSVFLYIFTVIEYIFFSFLLYHLIKSTIVKKAILICSLLFIVFCLYNIVDKPIRVFDSVQASIESILVLAYCIIYFYEQLNQPQISFIYTKYTFWLITGLLVYLSGTFFLYAFAVNLPDQTRINFWVINLICTILKNLFFTIAILIYININKKPPQKPVEPTYQPFLN